MTSAKVPKPALATLSHDRCWEPGWVYAFTEWTSANQLRHPRYLGLRTDKAAADVVRESR